jgi:phospholipid transport system substrate-binding protein
VLAAFTFAAAPAPAADETPVRLVRETTDKILALIKANRDAYARDPARLYAVADEIVLPHFDFRKMSQLVLQQAWREASEDQRARFTTEFRNLLVRTYATALLKYNDEQIVVLPFRPEADERRAVVKTEVRRSGGAAPVPIRYDFYRNKEGQWKVFDVTIEGVSLVTSYSTTYAERIRRDGLDALIASLGHDNRKPGAAAAPGGTARP